VKEFSLIGTVGPGEKPVRRRVATVEAASPREDFIARCTSQSLVVWRHGAQFGGVQARSLDRVHSPSHEGADAPIDDRLARPVLVASRTGR